MNEEITLWPELKTHKFDHIVSDCTGICCQSSFCLKKLVLRNDGYCLVSPQRFSFFSIFQNKLKSFYYTHKSFTTYYYRLQSLVFSMDLFSVKKNGRSITEMKLKKYFRFQTLTTFSERRSFQNIILLNSLTFFWLKIAKCTQSFKRLNSKSAGKRLAVKGNRYVNFEPANNYSINDNGIFNCFYPHIIIYTLNNMLLNG